MHTLYLSNALPELQLIVYLKKLLRYDIILIEHDCRYLYTKEQCWKDTLNRLLPVITKLVFIGNLTERSYHDNNMVAAQTTVMESAFLPPDLSDECSIVQAYPTELFAFIKQHKPVVLSNAFQLTLLHQQDLYGFDQLLCALTKLKQDVPRIGLVFVLAHIGNYDYYNQLINYIKLHELCHHCYFLIGQRPLWPLLKHIDLFVRPTLSDGASVSIEEALWVGKPVVATNVCVRPDAVTVYDLQDHNGLYNAIKYHI